MKWVFLIISIGCFANAAGFVKPSDLEDDNDDNALSLKTVVATDVPDSYSIKEKVLWWVGTLASLIITVKLF